MYKQLVVFDINRTMQCVYHMHDYTATSDYKHQYEDHSCWSNLSIVVHICRKVQDENAGLVKKTMQEQKLSNMYIPVAMLLACTGISGQLLIFQTSL